MATRFLIYGLTDPAGRLRYVGKSSNGLKVAKRHMMPCLLRKDRTDKGLWLHDLVSRGERPGIVVLEEIPDGGSTLDAAERRWIAKTRAEGAPLTNMSDGGTGASLGHAVKDETRRKQSEKAKARFATPEGLAHRALLATRTAERFAAARERHERQWPPAKAMGWLEEQHAYA